MMHKLRTVWSALLLPVLTVAALMLFAQPSPADAQAGLTNFTSVGVQRDLTVGDDTILGGNVTLSPATAISVTMNATITPASAYQPLESAGTVNTASITAGAAGDLLVLVNTVNTSIVLTDTGTLKLGGNRTLGQYDSLTLISDGTNWVELSFTNN